MEGTHSDPRFVDGKDAGALRTIGEVGSALGEQNADDVILVLADYRET